MRYLKSFNENVLDSSPYLKSYISDIFYNMMDDGFKLESNFDSYWVSVRLTGENTNCKLSNYLDDIKHFINYITDEGFRIFYLDVVFNNRRELNFTESTIEDMESSLYENKDNEVISILFSIAPES